MKNLILNESAKTPYFRLKEDGNLSFGGISMPEDAVSFYFDIIDWINNYNQNPKMHTNIRVGFGYLNSSSSKMVMKIFSALKLLQEAGTTKIKCQWYYDVDDNDMLDYIDVIKREASNIEFEVCPTQDVRELDL
jgi:hypothetical protein